MSMIPFYLKFPILAQSETRTFIVPDGNSKLPGGEYVFVELYCDDPKCDCRRVIVQIARAESPCDILATVNFGWESVDYYASWLGSTDGAANMSGASLEPFGEQSSISQQLLLLFRYAIQEGMYLERFKNHYKMFHP